MKRYLEELSYKSWEEMTLLDKTIMILICVIFCVICSIGGIR